MRFVVAVSWQVDFAITSDDDSLLIDQDRGVKALTLSRYLGVAEIKTDTELFGRIK